METITKSHSGGTRFLNIRWNNQSRTICSSLYKFFRAQKFTDTEIFCEGRRLKCHMIVLAAASPYFKMQLEAQQNGDPVLLPEGIALSTLEKVLEYIYKGEVIIDQNEADEFCYAAQQLKLEWFADEDQQSKPNEPLLTDQNNAARTTQGASLPRQNASAKNTLGVRENSTTTTSKQQATGFLAPAQKPAGDEVNSNRAGHLRGNVPVVVKEETEQDDDDDIVFLGVVTRNYY